jgi:hypothetical protein
LTWPTEAAVRQIAWLGLSFTPPLYIVDLSGRSERDFLRNSRRPARLR